VCRVLVVEGPWTPSNGMLTNDARVRRAAIARRYKRDIDAAYRREISV